jgi:Dolichyl-phosphate-mannose-protein mannosyltransferase
VATESTRDDQPGEPLPAVPHGWNPVSVTGALVVAALAFLPLLNWMPGGYDDPFYHDHLTEWISGGGIAVGLGVVLVILGRRQPGLWRAGAEPLGSLWRRSPGAFAAVVALLAAALYTAIGLLVFSGRPILIDELAQAMQARIFATGRLWVPSPPHPEFFSTLHMLNLDGRVFSQFPPGGPLMMTLGELIHAEWLVNPVCGALSVLLFARILRRVEARANIAAWSLVLFAFAPFTAFMAGSHMNHVPTLLFTLVGVGGLVEVTSGDRPRWGMSLLSGLGFGAAATIRPVDALAFALPAGLWYLWRFVRDRRHLLELATSGIGVGVPVALMLWFNARTTGHPMLFGYEALWGKSHDLGFHRAPWGLEHTPARGLELLNLYAMRLQRYLFETPIPSLLPAIGTLALTRRRSPLERYLLVSGAILMGLYFAYWHDGFYLGPRFCYSLLPLLALLSARFPTELRARLGLAARQPGPAEAGASGPGVAAYRATVYAMIVSAAIAVAYAIPIRVREYLASFPTIKWNVDQAAERLGVRHALVFVRESWESQLVTRLWALGVTAPETETLYRYADACLLERAVTRLEQPAGPRGEAAYAALVPLLADSARLELRRLASGANLRVLPGTQYTPRCVHRILESERGVIPLAPILLARYGGNVYARDLHERDTLLFQAFPDRPVWVLHAANATRDALPVFSPGNRDSMLAVWKATRE